MLWLLLLLLLFVTLYTGAAGCDGCINVNDSSNNGLADLVANLETVYQDNAFNASGVSRCSSQNSYLTRESCTLCPLCRADMWAILGLWAVQDGIDNSNDDCTDCNFTVPNIETSRGGAISYTDGRVVGLDITSYKSLYTS